MYIVLQSHSTFYCILPFRATSPPRWSSSSNVWSPESKKQWANGWLKVLWRSLTSLQPKKSSPSFPTVENSQRAWWGYRWGGQQYPTILGPSMHMIYIYTIDIHHEPWSMIYIIFSSTPLAGSGSTTTKFRSTMSFWTTRVCTRRVKPPRSWKRPT